METLSVYSLGSLWPILSTDWQMGLSARQSAAPVSALLSELETHVTSDHHDARKWLYPDTNTSYLSPPWYFLLPPPPLYWYLISIFRSQCNQTATVWLLVWAPTLSPILICLPSRLGAGQGAWLSPPRPRPRLTSSAGPCPRIIMRNRQILGSTKVFKCSKIFKWILSERTPKWIVTRV